VKRIRTSVLIECCSTFLVGIGTKTEQESCSNELVRTLTKLKHHGHGKFAPKKAGKQIFRDHGPLIY
jgi:hypothetical protein